MKNVIDAVNKLKGEWPAGYVMTIARTNGEIHYGEFIRCLNSMATNYGTSETFADYKAHHAMINDDMKIVIDWSKAPESCAGYSVSSCMSTYWVLDNEILMTAPDFGLTESKFTPRPEVNPALVDDDSRQAKLSNIGNILHNLSCSMDDEDEQNQFGEYASYLWDLSAYFGKSVSGAGDDKSVTVPVYTQEMCDNGVSPSVGMGCLCSFEDGKWEKVLIDFISEILAVVTDQYSAQYSFPIKEAKFKPLTPPIELIDKQHYLFSVNNGVQAVGQAYLSASNEWMINNLRTNSSFEASRCTNIQELEVKGEK